MAMELDQQTRDSIKLRLRDIGLAELLPQVEKLMLGYAAPLDSILLLNSAYLIGWQDGARRTSEKLNETLMSLARGKE